MIKFSIALLLVSQFTLLAQREDIPNDKKIVENKMEVIQKSIDQKVATLDNKYISLRCKILKEHIANLKIHLKKSMQNTDLEIANLINAKIKHIEKNLTLITPKNIPSITLTKSKIATHPFVGAWKDGNGNLKYLTADGKSIPTINNKYGSWKVVKNQLLVYVAAKDKTPIIFNLPLKTDTLTGTFGKKQIVWKQAK